MRVIGVVLSFHAAVAFMVGALVYGEAWMLLPGVVLARFVWRQLGESPVPSRFEQGGGGSNTM